MIVTFDFGTTAVKGVLTEENGKVLETCSVDIDTIYDGEMKMQEPRQWYRAFLKITDNFLSIYPKEKMKAIVMSGQMQDVILVDETFEAVDNAILYSDGRGQKQAEVLSSILGDEYLEQVTGNHYDGSLPVPKIMWVKEHAPEAWKGTSYVLISSKDYIIGKLTGEAVGDVIACATAGAMDIHSLKWDEKILQTAGIEIGKMPKLLHSHELAGCVTEQASVETGYLAGTKVFAGTGDAGATTLASGICRPGEFNINLGTSGWVAAVSDGPIQTAGGVFNLAAMPEHSYINVVPFLNAGNVHRWISRLFTPAEREQIDYPLMEQLLASSKPGSNGLLCLPYLVGERFPVLDAQAKGMFLGLTPETDQADMMRSALEGVAFSIRQGLESLGGNAQKITLIGGGARSEQWCQILADVLHEDIYVYRNADVLPALAISAAALIGLGQESDYTAFTQKLQGEEYCKIYHTTEDKDIHQLYDEQYKKYCSLYPVIRQLF